jgi:hypothetical protein
MEYTLYHGSVESFNKFDESKINPNETDALYNGFWFTSDTWASPAWRNPNYIKKCIVTVNNPAPQQAIRQTIKHLKDSEERYNYNSLQDAVRIHLKSLGYDGVIFNDIPKVNEQELNEIGKTEFYSARGAKYILEIDKEYGGLDLFDRYGEHITGYLDLEDFLSQQEQTIIAFSNDQIVIVEEIKQ